MRLDRVFITLMLPLTLTIVSTAPATAQPSPPPNPSDQDLSASSDAVVARASELGRLSGLVAELDRQAGLARTALAEQQEAAFQRLMELNAARDAAAEASRRVEAAAVETGAAGSAVDEAQRRLDVFATSTYQQTLDLGPLGLLTSADGPEDLVARAELADLVARDGARALDGLRRAEIGRVNAESSARALQEEAEAREEAARVARMAADAAVAAADGAVADQMVRLRDLDGRRAALQVNLDALQATDQRLRDQRERYDSYRQRAAREAEEQRRRAAQAAAADGASTVEPAVAKLGPQYACRAGVPRWGPVKPRVSAAGQLLRCRFGIGSVGGVGPRPNASDHPFGLALDFFVDRPTGDALAACALRNRGPLAVKYVIFRQRINSGAGWRQMEDRGSPVANHMEHVHISFDDGPGGSLGTVAC